MLRTVLIRSALRSLQSTSTLCAVTRINFQFHLEMKEEAEQPDKSLLTGPTISIIVGNEKKTWILHSKLLSFHSSFLAASRPEVADDKLEFLNDDPAAWSLLVKYLYQGSLPSLLKSSSAIEKYEHAVICHKLYNLSLRFSIPKLANLAMDRFRESLRSAHLVPDPEELSQMYTSSPAGSGMRKLLTKVAARQIMDPAKERDVKDYQVLLEREVGFAVGFIAEIRRQTGGVLLDDPNAGEGQEYQGEICRKAICGNGEKKVRFR